MKKIKGKQTAQSHLPRVVLEKFEQAYISKLPSNLKDDTANLNDRNKHKVTGQMNQQTADPKANASVFFSLT